MVDVLGHGYGNKFGTRTQHGTVTAKFMGVTHGDPKWGVLIRAYGMTTEGLENTTRWISRVRCPLLYDVPRSWRSYFYFYAFVPTMG